MKMGSNTWLPKKKFEGDARVAIVGLSVCYAGCENKEEFFDSLLKGEVQYREIDAERLDSIDKNMHLLKARSKYSDTCCNDKYAYLDKEKYRNEHELLLNLSRAAIDDYKGRKENTKNLIDFENDDIGVVSGCLSFPRDNQQGELNLLYQAHMEKKLQELYPEKETLRSKSLWSTRPEASKTNRLSDSIEERMDPASFVAENLKLKKNSVSYCIDAACATSLYTLRLGQEHLINGDCDVVLCGATTLPDPFFILSGFSTFQAIPVKGSKEDVSAPWRKGSTGLTPGEGGCIVVMKRLQDAVRDGDFIYTSMLACGVNNAGRGLPLKPLLDSELSCLRETYGLVGHYNQPKESKYIDYVECHATGTSQGDKVELDAMTQCYTELSTKMPLFGSSKGNFGHTLVAAGFAGMTKLLLSMISGQIPPTPAIESDAVSMHENVVRVVTSWPDSSENCRRGALSAFGFGGTNAHAVFERFSRNELYFPNNHTYIPKTLLVKRKKQKLAVLGVDASYGAAASLEEFESYVYWNKSTRVNIPDKRWRFLNEDKELQEALFNQVKSDIQGGFIEKIEVDFKDLRTPLKPEDLLIPQHLLCLSVMSRAIQQAKLPKGSRTAVIVGLGTELEIYRHKGRVMFKERLHESILRNESVTENFLNYIHDRGTSTSYTSYIGNLVATRLSAKYGFTGPSFTVTEGENSSLRAMYLAENMIRSGTVDFAVIAGVDFNGSAESHYIKSRNYDLRDQAIWLGEGSAAMVISGTEIAREKGFRIMANISDFSSSRFAFEKSVADTLSAFPNKIEACEFTGIPSSFHLSNQRVITLEDEFEAISRSCKKYSPKSIAASSLSQNFGQLGYSSGIASLVKCVLCLFNRYIPGALQGSDTAFSTVMQKKALESSFYLPKYSIPWVRNKEKGEKNRRHMALSSVSESNSHFFVLLSDEEGSHEASNRMSVDNSLPQIFLIHSKSIKNLLVELKELLVSFKGAESNEQTYLLQQIMHKGLNEIYNEPHIIFSIVSCENAEAFIEQLESALKGIPRTLKMNRNYVSSTGSFLALKPCKSEKICAMYGEGRAPYLSLGKDLYRIWPELHNLTESWTTEMWDANTLNEVFHPRCTTKKQYDREELNFENNQVRKFKSGVFHAMQFTQFAQNSLGINIKASCGLSLGEISMYFAFSKANCLQSNKLVKRLEESETWKRYMGGPCLAIKDVAAPNLTESEFLDKKFDDLWFGYVIPVSEDVIKEAMKSCGAAEKLRLMIVNSFNSVLVSGTPTALEALLNQLNILKSMVLPVPQRMIGHCKEVTPFLKDIAKIHETLQIPDSAKTDLKMYTNIGKCSVTDVVTEKFGNGTLKLGNLAGKIYEEVANFVSIIDAVYNDGYDVFIELGADNQRSSAVKNILNQKFNKTDAEITAVSIDSRRLPQWTSILKMLAILKSHQVPGVTLQNLYQERLSRVPKRKHKMIRDIFINGRFHENLLVLSPDQLAQLPPAQEKTLKRMKILSRYNEKEKTITSWKARDIEPSLSRDTSAVFSRKPVLSDFGSNSFYKCYNVRLPIVLGSMWRRISGVDFVVNASKNGILATYGAYQVPLYQVKQDLNAILGQLSTHSFAVNLTRNFYNNAHDKALLDVYADKKLSILELSRFTDITEPLLKYKILFPETRFIVKLNKPEVAKNFLCSCSVVFSRFSKIIRTLISRGQITEEQLNTFKNSEDSFASDIICIGSNPTLSVLPVISRLKLKLGSKCRIGVGSNISSGIAALTAFEAGADFVSTGSINLLSNEADVSYKTKNLISTLASTDMHYLPCYGMNLFDNRDYMPVVKKGSIFASHIAKLYELFQKYDNFEKIPQNDRTRIEKKLLKTSFDNYYEQLKAVLNQDPIERVRLQGFQNTSAKEYSRIKMALVFASLLRKGLENCGSLSSPGKTTEALIWCSSSIGAFNGLYPKKKCGIVQICDDLFNDMVKSYSSRNA